MAARHAADIIFKLDNLKRSIDDCHPQVPSLVVETALLIERHASAGNIDQFFADKSFEELNDATRLFENKFPWSKKGKNRECEVKESICIARKCFKPADCGTVDPKTQQKNIVGKCKTMHENGCPIDYYKPENYVTYNGRKNR